MPVIPWVPGLPGFRSAETATPRLIFRQGEYLFLANGKVISGAQSRDPGNTGNIGRLRAGLLMGKITSSGLYAPAIVGATSASYTSGGTELTVSAAVATELDRLVGQSGTAELVAIGPPSAAGTVAVTAFDHSAINTTTGVITVTSLGVNKIAGTFIAVNDGRYTPLSVVPDDFPIATTDGSGTSIDVPYPRLPIGGVIVSANVLPVWPSDTSLRAWIRTNLSTASYGKFVFDDAY